ncbi:MAG: hypothetical protein Q7U91_13225 [Sideroxyarcus sp.]|nr:hypothetical protein [Sideroxyarcus sp.]
MKQSTYREHLQWLKSNPSLDELCAKYPAEWAAVQAEISAIVERGAAEELKAYLERLSAPDKSSAAKQRDEAVVLSHFVRSRMAHESVKKLCLSTLAADTGVTKGKLRFNLFNGFIAQKLLFARALERKPVSLFWFRLLWPLVWQRKRLMPLVQPRGIYCFYSRELIRALAGMIAGRSCVEIGAGDGTLTRFLQEQGVRLTATDSHAWSTAVQYPEWVVKMDAREALSGSKPEVVLCSWPPAQNDFERAVFDTPSVQLYIVIGSRHRFAFGNWNEYLRQTAFELQEDKALGALLLPPELESAVYVFRRKGQAA